MSRPGERSALEPEEAQPPSKPANMKANTTPAAPARAFHSTFGVQIMGSSLLLGRGIRRHLPEHHDALPGHALGDAGAVLHVAGELAARRGDVVAPGLPHSGDD